MQPCEICGTSTATEVYDRAICPECSRRIREYEDRVSARLERMRARAATATTVAHRDLERAHGMASVIPFGQPILVGHHSERRDRRYRDRIERTFRRGFERLAKANRLAERVHAAEDNRAISSDDPSAVLKLQVKLDGLTETQEWMKRANQAVRKVTRQYPDKVQRIEALAQMLDVGFGQAETLLLPDYVGRVVYPAYMLQNNSARIRSIKLRLEELKRQAEQLTQADSPITEEEVAPGITLVRDLEDNRLRLIFEGKPEASVRATLKQRGFRWSPSAGAWQRQLNNAAEYAAQMVIESLAK